jgi:hypothetical protein
MSSATDHMTSSEIDTSIRELKEIARSGKMTPAQADRLSELGQARRRIDRVTRSPPWWR